MARSKDSFVDDLYRTQALPLVKFLTARFRDPESAREVAQEAWLRMYRIDHPEQLDNAKAFLFQTAANLAIDRKRHQAVELRHQEGSEPTPEAVSVEQIVADRESIDRIADALKQLPPKCQTAFLMHRTQGHSYHQIAEHLGVSVSMVEKYIIRALKHFRNTLQ